jgi:hypothetical protein
MGTTALQFQPTVPRSPAFVALPAWPPILRSHTAPISSIVIPQ